MSRRIITILSILLIASFALAVCGTPVTQTPLHRPRRLLPSQLRPRQ
jgi:hypothetical protein